MYIDIKEWTGIDFTSSTKAAENRSKQKGVVAKSSVVSERPCKATEQNKKEK